MRASASWPATSSALARAAVAATVAASALAQASASALPRFIQNVTIAASEPAAAISAPQVRMSAKGSPLEDPRDLLDRAAAEIRGDDDAGPGCDIAGEWISGSERQQFVPNDDLREIGADDIGHQRTRERRPPSPLLRDDDGGGLLARLDVGLDLLDRKLNGERVFAVRGRKLGLVGFEERSGDNVEHRARQELHEPLHDVRP